jgi:hypothetical protein
VAGDVERFAIGRSPQHVLASNLAVTHVVCLARNGMVQVVGITLF